MTYITKPKLHHPKLPTNALGFTHRDYEGAISTLCAGCGHDSISAAIIQACFELALPPHRIAKLSGIGCSSKTPTYFLGASHGFNSVHGRMPSVLTGANLANRDLIYLGVSGDGDSASIGLGQFAHSIRRGVNMVYIVENNGVYGLTKGQFSATSDKGSKNKRGVANTDEAIDMVAMAMQLGATFVGRSFSGDKAQLVPLIKAALLHEGAAFIDCISPCVAFNNHAGSTKSFDFVREHNEAVNRLDVILGRQTITVDYAPGEVEEVEQHDGSVIRLRKVAPGYDPYNRITAMNYLQERNAAGEFVTGLLYMEKEPSDLHKYLDTVKTPLNAIGEKELVPGAAALAKFNAQNRWFLSFAEGPMSLDPKIVKTLAEVASATITTILLKKGLRNVWMRGARPLVPGLPRLVGRAFTLRFVPAREDLATPESWSSPKSTRAAIEAMPAGCIAVVDAMGITDAGIFGDILCARMQKLGVAGLVTDGVVRDLAGVLSTKLPVWCQGAAAPPSVAGLTFVDWQQPIGCGGVAVFPDDVVVVDADGAVCIPAALLDDVVAAAPEQERMEAWIMTEVEKGAALPGLYPMNAETKARYDATLKKP